LALKPDAPPPTGYGRAIINNEIYYYNNATFSQNVQELTVDSNTICVPEGNHAGINASACANSSITNNIIIGDNTTDGFGVMVGQLYSSDVSPRPATSFLRSKYFVSTGGY
jgi:hypothetical protein